MLLKELSKLDKVVCSCSPVNGEAEARKILKEFGTAWTYRDLILENGEGESRRGERGGREEL